MKYNMIWIDENIESEEQKELIKILDSFGKFAIRLFKNEDKAIDYISLVSEKLKKIILIFFIY